MCWRRNPPKGINMNMIGASEHLYVSESDSEAERCMERLDRLMEEGNGGVIDEEDNGTAGVGVAAENEDVLEDQLDDCYSDDNYHSGNSSEDLDDKADDLEAFDGVFGILTMRILS